MSGTAVRKSIVPRMLRFVRFSHTVFALPFALGSMLVAARGWPSWRTFGLIILAMVTARTAAMTFNRIVDWKIDQTNPRTADRHRLVTRPTAWFLLTASSVGFVATAYFINPLCFKLSPVALFIVFFYSVTKRFTSGTHFFLGLALAVSPVGAWLAVKPEFELPPMVLALAVLFWVAGFDIIYATLDYVHDRAIGLKSMVVRLGLSRSLKFARTLHLLMFLSLVGFGYAAGLGMPYYVGLACILAALVYEHGSASRLDAEAVNRAFFHTNAFVGVVLLAAIWMDVALQL